MEYFLSYYALILSYQFGEQSNVFRKEHSSILNRRISRFFKINIVLRRIFVECKNEQLWVNNQLTNSFLASLVHINSRTKTYQFLN